MSLASLRVVRKPRTVDAVFEPSAGDVVSRFICGQVVCCVPVWQQQVFARPHARLCAGSLPFLFLVAVERVENIWKIQRIWDDLSCGVGTDQWASQSQAAQDACEIAKAMQGILPPCRGILTRSGQTILREIPARFFHATKYIQYFIGRGDRGKEKLRIHHKGKRTQRTSVKKSGIRGSPVHCGAIKRCIFIASPACLPPLPPLPCPPPSHVTGQERSS